MLTHLVSAVPLGEGRFALRDSRGRDLGLLQGIPAALADWMAAVLNAATLRERRRLAREDQPCPRDPDTLDLFEVCS